MWPAIGPVAMRALISIQHPRAGAAMAGAAVMWTALLHSLTIDPHSNDDHTHDATNQPCKLADRHKPYSLKRAAGTTSASAGTAGLPPRLLAAASAT